MRFSDSINSAMISELRRCADGSMDIVEMAMRDALRESQNRNQKSVSVEQIKQHIKRLLEIRLDRVAG
jgi:hypothetical protein